MNGMMGYGFGGGMMLFGVICGILIIVGIVLLVKWLVEQSKVGAAAPAGETALDILKKRYAKGEIDKKEFEEKKKDLI